MASLRNVIIENVSFSTSHKKNSAITSLNLLIEFDKNLYEC